MPEVGPQETAEGPNELSVGQAQQEMILHVLRKQEGPFLRAGRAEVEGFTRKRTEILASAMRISAMNFSITSVMRSMRKRP